MGRKKRFSKNKKYKKKSAWGQSSLVSKIYSSTTKWQPAFSGGAFELGRRR